MESLNPVLDSLRSHFEETDNVWFFVNVSYRILYFNKKAAANSVLFHARSIKAGDSILDYARDTKNQVDEAFITCLGKAASGQVITRDEQIEYNDHSLSVRTIYTPVYTGKHLDGISIEVQDITTTQK